MKTQSTRTIYHRLYSNLFSHYLTVLKKHCLIYFPEVFLTKSHAYAN